MEPEELFGALLALGECWWVKGVIYQESLRRFVIEIEETDQLWSHERCPEASVWTVGMYTGFNRPGKAKASTSARSLKPLR